MVVLWWFYGDIAVYTVRSLCEFTVICWQGLLYTVIDRVLLCVQCVALCVDRSLCVIFCDHYTV